MEYSYKRTATTVSIKQWERELKQAKEVLGQVRRQLAQRGTLLGYPENMLREDDLIELQEFQADIDEQLTESRESLDDALGRLHEAYRYIEYKLP